MVVSYYMEVILLTMIFVFTAVGFRQRHSRAQTPSGIPNLKSRTSRIIDAFSASILTFLETAVVFSTAVTAAWLHSRTSADGHEKDTDQKVLLESLAAMFSVFPVLSILALLTLTDGSKKTELTPRNVLMGFILLVLLIVDMVLVWHRSAHESKGWEPLCIASPVETWLLAPRIMWGLFFSVLVLYVLPTALYHGSGKRRNQIGSEKKRRIALWTMATASLLMAWIILVLFTFNRQRYIDMTSKSNPETKWTFGQILAIFTWLTVIANLVFFLLNPSKCFRAVLVTKIMLTHYTRRH